jgi:hypothetical protein
VINPSLDLSVVDSLETVTYRRRGETPGSAGTTVSHALRRAVTTREAAASDGRYTTSDVAWHLPAAELPFTPRLGDMICDGSGQRWTILSAVHATLGSRWRCLARSLALVFGLDDVLAVLRPSGSNSSDPIWTVWRTGIRARIQPASTERDGQQTVRQVKIFVAEALGLDATWRLRSARGTIYAMIRETAAERIGELAVIEAEVLG